jgi:hypothetical protein
MACPQILMRIRAKVVPVIQSLTDTWKRRLGSIRDATAIRSRLPMPARLAHPA